MNFRVRELAPDIRFVNLNYPYYNVQALFFNPKKKMEDDYQFDDVDVTASAPTPTGTGTGTGQSDHGYGMNPPKQYSGNSGSGGGSYASELFSKQIKAKFRTFYVDLKESSNGKFLKISEKNNGRKSTIMMDAEDIPAFIEALQEVQQHL